MKQTLPTANRLDVMFRAFSDRTRLRILYLLQGGECCVGNIVDILDIEQPSASRHLAYLRKAGLVSVRKAGLWSYYSLAAARQPFHLKLLECLSCCFSVVPEIRADQARAKRVREAGGCCPGEEKPTPRNTGKAANADKPEECCPSEAP
jgi:ArsR family transcriptional regulator